MNRTAILFATAAALACLAVVVGRPVVPAVPPVNPTPVPVPEPEPAPGALTQGFRLTPRVSHRTVHTAGQDVYLDVSLEALAGTSPARGPMSLAVVVDRSGSMAGNKLAHAKAAAHRVVERLVEGDFLALVDYGSNVRVKELQAVTPAAKSDWHAFIDAIEDDGGTNISAGLDEALLALRAAPMSTARRAILLSDGQPTEGDTSSEGLVARIRTLRGSGITVSSVGIGADFNENLMQALAEVGGGTYGYVHNESQVSTALNADLDHAARTVARQVKVRVEFPQGVVLQEVFGHSVTHQGGQAVITVPDLVAGFPHSVVMRARITPGEASDHLFFANVVASFDAAAGQATPTRLESKVFVARSSDRSVVAAHQDRTVALNIARAESAEHMKRATDAYVRRDAEGAQVATAAARRALFAAMPAVGEAAVTQEIQDMESAVDSVRLADDATRSAAAKEAKVSALKKQNFAAGTY